MSQQDTYRKCVLGFWQKGRIDPTEVSHLANLQASLGLTSEEAEQLEQEVLGMTKEEAMIRGLGADAPSPNRANDKISGLRTEAPRSPAREPDDDSLVGPTWVPPPPGQSSNTRVIGDRYEILEELGRGGMGRVFKVKDTRLDEIRALKVLAPKHSDRPDLLDRMRREVKLCQRLRHESIAQVFDFDIDAATGQAYFCMELVDGVTLRQWLASKSQETMPLDQVASVTTGLIKAVDYAHHKRVVHHDLKPENVLVSRDLRKVHVLDFGIARALDLQGLQTGPSGAGTPYYMAPEQERGDPAMGPPADVYSLGAILYELLTGKPPRGNFPPPRSIRAEVPEAWSDAVMNAMRPAPQERPTLRHLLQTLTKATDAALLVLIRRQQRDYHAATTHSWENGKSLLAAFAAEHLEAWREAAMAGRAVAQYLLGHAYADGAGVEKNPQISARWFRSAAEQGHECAQFELGKRYFFGTGLTQDRAEAVEWLRLAAEQGHAGAQKTLQERATESTSTAQNHSVQPSEWLTYEEALHKLRIGEEDMRSLVEQGEILAYRDGDGMKFRASDVDCLVVQSKGVSSSSSCDAAGTASGAKGDDGCELWLSMEEAADKLQLSGEAIQQLVSSGDLMAYPDGDGLKFKPEDIATRSSTESEDDGGAACLGCLFVAVLLWYFDVHIMAWDVVAWLAWLLETVCDVVAWPFRAVAGLFE